ncbi:hypothetical protein MKQ68_00730 [Chitinophaga horti]|uniref:Uncharacterized protein n=1 Tax=Chitinophaga horti TaxID=2920382 RepID=A0ABY6J627_9BACT|nr:hypothetical protein [Chitinophaga horti]UYQ93624.1 hypothetical protein MKQ68_00730 [Chitinophaga horti]
MKLKIALLALPIIILIYVFLIRDHLSAGNSIGGGSYDLTKMYTLFGMGLYLLIYNVTLLLMGIRGNGPLLLIGAASLVLVIVTAVRTF